MHENEMPSRRRRRRRIARRVMAVALCLAAAAPLAMAAATAPAAAGAVSPVARQSGAAAPSTASNANALEAAAARAGETGRKVATSLIALAFAIAAIVLTFKRDFKEAVGVFAVGIVAVMLVSPAGLNVLRDTVALLFGSQ